MTNDNNNEFCFICMDESSSPLLTVPCDNGHNNEKVHLKCVYEWQERSGNSCPICRNPLNEIDYTVFDKIGISLMKQFGFRKQFAM